MTSKVDQLFLELCLLTRRYSAAEIERVANVSEVIADPHIRDLLAALKEIQRSAPIAKSAEGGLRKSKRTVKATHDKPSVRKTIDYFVEQIAQSKVLGTSEQLENFARSIGINGASIDRQELLKVLRQNLERMPPSQAVQKMRSVDRYLKSDSDAYVDLAKTLMRS